MTVLKSRRTPDGGMLALPAERYRTAAMTAPRYQSEGDVTILTSGTDNASLWACHSEPALIRYRSGDGTVNSAGIVSVPIQFWRVVACLQGCYDRAFACNEIGGEDSRILSV